MSKQNWVLCLMDQWEPGKRVTWGFKFNIYFKGHIINKFLLQLPFLQQLPVVLQQEICMNCINELLVLYLSKSYCPLTGTELNNADPNFHLNFTPTPPQPNMQFNPDLIWTSILVQISPHLFLGPDSDFSQTLIPPSSQFHLNWSLIGPPLSKSDKGQWLIKMT